MTNHIGGVEVKLAEPSFQIFHPDLVAAFPAQLEIDWLLILDIYGLQLKIAVELGDGEEVNNVDIEEARRREPGKVVGDLCKYLIPPPQLHIFSVTLGANLAKAGMPVSSHTERHSIAPSLLKALLHSNREKYEDVTKLEEDSEFNNYLNIALLYASPQAIPKLVKETRAKLIVFGNSMTKKKWSIIYPQQTSQNIEYIDMNQEDTEETAKPPATGNKNIAVLTPYLPAPLAKKAAQSISTWLSNRHPEAKPTITIVDTGLKESAEAAETIKEEIRKQGFKVERRTATPGSRGDWSIFAEKIEKEGFSEVVIVSEFPKEAVVATVEKIGGQPIYVAAPKLKLNRSFLRWLEKTKENPETLLTDLKEKFTVEYAIIKVN